MFHLQSHDALAYLGDDTLKILLSSITLHVTQSDEHYWLLMPDPLFEVLRHHPNALAHRITLCLHDDAQATISTLMFIQPALQHQFNPLSLSELALRLQAAKSYTSSIDELPPNKLPSKTTLAKLADVSPSAIRCNVKG